MKSIIIAMMTLFITQVQAAQLTLNESIDQSDVQAFKNNLEKNIPVNLVKHISHAEKIAEKRETKLNKYKKNGLISPTNKSDQLVGVSIAALPLALWFIRNKMDQFLFDYDGTTPGLYVPLAFGALILFVYWLRPRTINSKSIKNDNAQQIIACLRQELTKKRLGQLKPAND